MRDSLQDRYAAIERLYSQGQWTQVLEASTALLAELAGQPGDPLQTRLLLLQGHTQLFGFGRTDAATHLYQQVLDSDPEPVLRAIAEQELERCRLHQSAPFPFTAQAVGTAPEQQPAAMPWLDALVPAKPAPEAVISAMEPAQPCPTEAPMELVEVVDVVDEPDQVAVQQADPRRAEILELTPTEQNDLPQATPAGRWSPAEEAELAKGLLRVVLG